MSIIINPKTTRFYDLLRTSKYEIPNLQRDFDWQKNELEKFWKDSMSIYNDDIDEYFLGPMVFVKEGETYHIIDGQQRLLTTSILLSTIRDFLNKINSESPAQTITNSITWLNTLLFQNMSSTGIGTGFRITPSETNERFYKDHIVSQTQTYTEKIGMETPSEISNQRILEAYKFFIKKINSEWSEKFSKVLPEFIESVVKAFEVIIIEVDSIENSHRVFETLNYRGKDLSVNALVKNFLLEKTDNVDFRDNYQKWMEMSEILKNIKLDDFLKHFWIANYHLQKPDDVEEGKKLKYKIVTPSNLFDKVIDEIDSSQKVNLLLDELVKSSKVYKQLREPKKNDWYNDEDIISYLNELNILANDSAQPLLLNAKIFWDDQSKIKEVIKGCSIIHFRSKTIGTKKPNELVSTMADIALEIRKKKENYSVSETIKKLSELDTTDENFVSNFKTRSYSGKIASYVLRKIESFLNGEYTVTEITSKATLEHILPQTPNDHWSGIFDEEKQQRCVSKIGNLTLLHSKLNSQAQNFPFLKKLDEYKKQSGIRITEELLSETTWTEEKISDRTKKLAESAKKIWKLN